MDLLRTRLVRFALAAGIALTLPGCGYALQGHSNNLPAWIKTIGVPLFVNQSTVPEVEVAMTDAVRAEFQSHGYRAVSETEGTDAVFTATITSVRLTAIAFTPARQASRYAGTVTASVVFKDNTGKTWWSNPNARFTEEYDVSTSTTANDPTAFFGQNLNALDRLAKSFAQSVVTSILDSF